MAMQWYSKVVRQQMASCLTYSYSWTPFTLLWSIILLNHLPTRTPHTFIWFIPNACWLFKLSLHLLTPKHTVLSQELCLASNNHVKSQKNTQNEALSLTSVCAPIGKTQAKVQAASPDGMLLLLPPLPACVLPWRQLIWLTRQELSIWPLSQEQRQLEDSWCSLSNIRARWGLQATHREGDASLFAIKWPCSCDICMTDNRIKVQLSPITATPWWVLLYLLHYCLSCIMERHIIPEGAILQLASQWFICCCCCCWL